MYCYANRSFSPTYEEIIFFTYFFPNNSPIPNVETPALFEMQVKSLDPFFDKASISFSGRPHWPNPPIAIDAPSLMSLTASSAVLQNSTEKALAP